MMAVGVFLFLGLCALVAGGFMITGFCLLFIPRTRWLGASLLVLPLILAALAMPVVFLMAPSSQSFDVSKSESAVKYESEMSASEVWNSSDSFSNTPSDWDPFAEVSGERVAGDGSEATDAAAPSTYNPPQDSTLEHAYDGAHSASNVRLSTGPTAKYVGLLIIGVVLLVVAVLVVGVIALIVPNTTDSSSASWVGKAFLLGASVVLCLGWLWVSNGQNYEQHSSLVPPSVSWSQSRDEASSGYSSPPSVVAEADDSTTPSESETTSDPGIASEDDSETIYTCPMHPQVRQSEPGQCPTCAMELVLAPDRPDWVDQQAYTEGGVFYVPVTSGPFENSDACEEALELVIDDAVEQYVARVVGQLRSTQLHKIVASIPSSNIVADRYIESRDLSIGPLDEIEMKQHYALLKFDSQFENQVAEQERNIVVKARLAQTALFSGGFIALLATCFGFLRIDTASQGAYTRRLQFASAAVILVVLVTGMILSRTILWM